MIVPEFVRFYGGYTVRSTMQEMAITFFSLVNSMYRIQSSEMIDDITSTSIGMADPKERTSALEKLEKSSAGIHGIVQEVRQVKKP